MRGIVAGAKYCIIFLGITAGLLGPAVGAQSAASTMVGATICVASSSITLDAPVTDSVVTQPAVALSGTVSQASQIDVYIDDVFDHVIPLTIGQTNFSGSAQLTARTHTLKVVAINVCPGTDASASSVVTYTPPPTPPSTGGETPTTVEPEPSSGTTVVSNEKITSAPEADNFPELVGIEFNSALKWLNITVSDNAGAKRLSVWRAVVMGAGVYLLVIGMAATVVQMMAGIPVLAAALPGSTPTARHRWISWSFRILGLLLVLGALFL